MARLLITGGAGFIGSHTCVVLIEAGHDLIIFDSFQNSSPIAIERVAKITHLGLQEQAIRLQIIKGDIRDKKALEYIFETALYEKRPIDAVIHFAGLKAVSESIRNPIDYWDVNVNGSLSLLSAMASHNCRTIIFSSSATIYGAPKSVPIFENAEIQPNNPYGNTKATIENILVDISNCHDNWRIAKLRYFNPVGAHTSGEIGENPLGTPNNLFPIVSQVAIGNKKILNVLGGDWPTPDGTCIRDYIHIMDLAEGHLAALNFLFEQSPQCIALNLGSGQGHSVLEIVKSFEITTKRSLNYAIVDRRPGDVAITIADPSKAKQVLGWQTHRSILDSCRDIWNWHKVNPHGYSKKRAS